MGKLFKALLFLTILLICAFSIYFGLRIFNTPYTYEYLNNSLVVTIPNKVWFEIDNQQDYTTKGEKNTYIFQNDLIESKKTGYDIGLSYPTLTGTTQNSYLSKTDIVTRQKDTISISRNIQIQNLTEYEKYISRITFSQFGTFLNDTYTQEGCSINITSQNGDITYDKQIAAVEITYQIPQEGKITDTLNISISCLGL